MMGLVLKEEDIKEYLQEKGLLNSFTKDTIVYAQIMPSAGQFFLFGAYTQLVKGDYFAMCLDEKQIVLIQLNKLSGKINRKIEPILLPFEEIKSVHIKNGILMYTITLFGEKGEEVPLKLSKTSIGMAWHKNHLENVLKRLQSV
ncbi:hypothetical protein LZ578_11390 [Jeotgalibaca sp. MA1X17-3]|uniref:hypothetical protein n=1 Tax=Jeotgalibaca sp. MA1X17-3 TaxID=2908211 RepID=UPI001F3AB7D8|nr:hypothetical protein [Jeotgalibaca sp. MA1X17-3]UJF15549.1 hypothetical protein LZ578_11390 [Jeotgalibaca sp. MA1X17-3]